MNPGDFEALNAHATGLRESGKLIEATLTAKRAIEANPESPTGYFTLGLCHLATKMDEQAAACFERAISLKPGFANYHHHLGLAYERLGRGELAKASYRSATRLAPTVLHSYLALAQLAERTRSLEEAVETYCEALTINPAPGGLVKVAELLAMLNRHEEARQALLKALAFDPNLGIAHELLGNVLEEQGHFVEAGAEFQQALSLQPEKASITYKIARSKLATELDLPFLQGLEVRLSEPDLGIDQVRFLHYTLGKLYDDLGEFGKAITHFDQSNRLSERLQMAGKRYPRDQVRSAYDAMIATFTPTYLARNGDVGSVTECPIFIVGMMRSGTTLVEQILSSHPQVAAGGELPYWLDPDANELLQGMLRGKLDRIEVRRLTERYLQRLAALSDGRKRVTDKMPNNYMVLGLLHLLFPNARIIHCRRHPVDNCLSIFTTVYTDPPKFAYNRENIVFGYRQYSRLMSHWRRVLPTNRFMEVDYEAIVEDPEEVSRQMVDFCGLDWNDACLRHERNDRIVKTPSLWQVRQPVYATSVGRWRNYVPWLGAFKELLEPQETA